MKKFVTIFGVVLAALALAGVAWAATAQGKLTGELKWNTPGSQAVRRPRHERHPHDLDQPADRLADSGRRDRVYINKNNDTSGDCTGDSGTNHCSVHRRQCGKRGLQHHLRPLLELRASHGNMSFDYFDTHYGKYLVVSVVYKGVEHGPDRQVRRRD